MKEDSLTELAKKLNISKSTICKAIRHCSGVDSETRQLILDALPAHSSPRRKGYPIYAIIPDVPQYFWKNLMQGLMDGDDRKNIPVKYNIYTRCTDEATVLHYLSEAEKMDIKVLILAAYITPAIKEKLEGFTDRCLVILLTEYFELKNSFFIGADGYRDGCMMGKAYLSEYRDKNLIYFDITDNYSAAKRLNGFLDTVKENAPEVLTHAVRIQFDNSIFRDLKILSARLASLLSGNADPQAPYCLYSPSGMVQLPIAIKKAELNRQIVCLCHDCSVENGLPEEGYHIGCNQNIYAQGLAASKAAIDYIKNFRCPGEKYLLIPSELYCRDKK